MQRPFRLERYFALHEHRLEVMLSSSDCEPMTARELFDLAGAASDELLDARLGYTEARGSARLRAAIARHHPGCTEDDVLVVNAPQEAVLLSLQALVHPGDRVVVLTPCYQSLWDVALERGADVVSWPVVPRGLGFGLDLSRLAELLADPATLLVTNFPHNPTGACPTREEWAELTLLVERSGARWFSDEMYRGLTRDDSAELPPAASELASAVSLSGLSKSLNLPGLRLGWLVSRDRALLAEIERRKDWTSICANALSEICAEKALAISGELFRRNRARIARNEAALARFLAERGAPLGWTPPAAGPVSLAAVSSGTATDLARRARERGRALLVPSALFELEDRWVRLGLGREGFEGGLARLALALASDPA